ncbi:Hypothetical predicted protein [Marmota monax]|uniref:Uncharacterized protein n=1 Tax=Marmota monax TaxID=9995 RepID=A0A5E4BXB8_MARMO|nr:hypothetical protein GHT09_014666 [Marmota monax]VTJ73886.1 Hypothetical predicted protein [Marmota monax]
MEKIQPPELSSAPAAQLSWEEDRKFILRGWSLVFIVLSALMVFSVVDGQMAYLQGSYTGYLGFWTNCRRHKCPDMGQVTVLIHMSKGLMMLAMALCLLLLLSMSLSFRPLFRRLSKLDLVFSSLSISIVNCQILRPRPQVSYMVTFYLCWCASALMLWAGILSYLNQVGVWSSYTSSLERPVSSRRWASQQCPLRRSCQVLDLPRLSASKDSCLRSSKE